MKSLIAFRNSNPALLHGTFSVVESPPGTLAFVRALGSEKFTVVLNLSDKAFPNSDFAFVEDQNPILATHDVTTMTKSVAPMSGVIFGEES